jgi:arsenate reductase (thioredoxin)
VIVARFATDRLTALAPSRGAIAKAVPEVLFVCVHNASRFQMAAALLDKAGAGRVQVCSAGSLPATEIHPAVTEATAEIGIDLTEEFPKPFTDIRAPA